MLKQVQHDEEREPGAAAGEGTVSPSRRRERQRDLRIYSLVAAGWAPETLLPSPDPSHKWEGRDQCHTADSG
jgi:hypothetical protein